MTDLSKLAASLSSGQKQALVWHNPFYGSVRQGWPESTREETSFAKAGRRLMDLRLISWTRDSRSSVTRITDLGLQLRRYLQEMDRGD